MLAERIRRWEWVEGGDEIGEEVREEGKLTIDGDACGR